MACPCPQHCTMSVVSGVVTRGGYSVGTCYWEDQAGTAKRAALKSEAVVSMYRRLHAKYMELFAEHRKAVAELNYLRSRQ